MELKTEYRVSRRDYTCVELAPCSPSESQGPFIGIRLIGLLYFSISSTSGQLYFSISLVLQMDFAFRQIVQLEHPVEFASVWLVIVKVATVTFKKIDNNIATDLSL